ncbi:MAG: AAA family ATPase [Thermoleophilia bacterium]|nr:AAA family ATPase [Thermoleophilia bacterium]
MGRVGKPSKKSGVAAQEGPGRQQALIIPKGYVRVRESLAAGAPLVFVSGNAGTGKTTLIRYLRESLDLRCVVLAPTGVAALNAGGVTVHSFFRFPPRIQDPRDVRVPADCRLYQSVELLIIDEVSMLRADLLDCIDVFLRQCNSSFRPFGGVQLLFLGDLFQLPPVVSRAEGQVLAHRGYATPYFFSASVLDDVHLLHVELDENFRQSDAHFVSLLNRLRVGEDLEAVVEELNSRCLGESSGHEITLACTNQVADGLNAAAMAALDCEEVLFVGATDGKFKVDGDRLPSPLELRLKVGARVMFTKNDESGRWVNGTLGVVTWLSGDRVEVQLTDGSVREVERVTWQTVEYRVDQAGDRIVAHEVGHFAQYPLMLAWAVTIHKSQGKTLGNILVDFGWGAFAPGQAYVALSRCRSLENLRLARPLRVSDVRCDARVRHFYTTLTEGRRAPDEGVA